MLCTHAIPRFPLTGVLLADLNGVLGNYATLGLNIADFSRYANKPSAQNVQAIVIPIIFSEFPAAHSHAELVNHLDSQLLLACLVSSLPRPLRRHMAKSFGTPSKSSVSGWNPGLMVAALLPPLAPSACSSSPLVSTSRPTPLARPTTSCLSAPSTLISAVVNYLLPSLVAGALFQ